MNPSLPVINIQVIDWNTNQADRLIRYWLSLDKSSTNENILEVYSKIFWLENNPIQINIYNTTTDIGPSKLDINYHARVHLIQDYPIDFQVKSEGIYTCVIILGSIDKNLHALPFNYFNTSLTAQDSGLVTFLDTVMRHAYQAARRAYRNETFNLQKPKVTPVLYPSTVVCLEDEFIYLDNPDNTNTNCCCLL